MLRRKAPLTKYREKLERYIRVFGRENIGIRTFDPARFVGGDLISDFLVAVGEAPQLAQSLDVVRANRSMSHEAMMILSETNGAIPVYIEGRANRARAFDFNNYLESIEGEKFAIDPNLYRDQEDEILADLEWLHATIGEPVFARPTPRPTSEPRWSEATVRSIQTLVAGMARELQELRRQAPHAPRPAVPAKLAWLRNSYDQTGPGRNVPAGRPPIRSGRHARAWLFSSRRRAHHPATEGR